MTEFNGNRRNRNDDLKQFNQIDFTFPVSGAEAGTRATLRHRLLGDAWFHIQSVNVRITVLLCD